MADLGGHRGARVPLCFVAIFFTRLQLAWSPFSVFHICFLRDMWLRKCEWVVFVRQLSCRFLQIQAYSSTGILCYIRLTTGTIEDTHVYKYKHSHLKVTFIVKQNDFAALLSQVVLIRQFKRTARTTACEHLSMCQLTNGKLYTCSVAAAFSDFELSSFPDLRYIFSIVRLIPSTVYYNNTSAVNVNVPLVS